VEVTSHESSELVPKGEDLDDMIAQVVAGAELSFDADKEVEDILNRKSFYRKTSASNTGGSTIDTKAKRPRRHRRMAVEIDRHFVCKAC